MTKFQEIGRFRYREPKIPHIAKQEGRYPLVVLYGDQAFRPLVPFFIDAINDGLQLEAKHDHKVVVEQLGEGKERRFRLTVNEKKMLMVNVPF